MAKAAVTIAFSVMKDDWPFVSVAIEDAGLQACVAMGVENDFNAFCHWLIASMPSLIAATWKGISNAINECTKPLREIL